MRRWRRSCSAARVSIRVSAGRLLIVIAAVLAGLTLPPGVTRGRAASPDSAPPLPAPTGQVVNVSTEPQLRNAVAALTSGTTIVIAPGTYRLTATLYINKAVSDVVIRGASNNRGDVVLVGKGMAAAGDGGVPFGIWTGGGVTRITIANLTIRDVYYHPLIFNPGTVQPRVYNVALIDAGQQFLKANPDGAGGGVDGGVVEYCVFEYTTVANNSYTNGVDVHTGDDWVIRHSLFRRIRSNAGLAGPAILMWNNSRNTIVEGNTFIDNHRDIHLGLIERTPNDHTGGVVRNNMIVRRPGAGGDVGIGVFDSPGTRVVHNSLWMGGQYGTGIEYRFPDTTGVVIANNFGDTSVWARDGAGGGTVTNNVSTAVASDFISPSTGDLHLSGTAIAALDKVPVHADAPADWDGEARPAGGAADLGADERGGAAGVPVPPESCGDGVDNDGDGAVDEGCPAPPPPALELCGDGADNDGDGIVDDGCAGPAPAVAPGPAARVSARANGSSVSVSWLAPIVGGRVDGYVLDAGLSPGTTAASVPLGAVTGVTIPNVGAGTYYLRVRAVGPGGSGPASADAPATVGGCPAAARPWPLTAYINGVRLSLTWTDGSGCSQATRLIVGTQSGGANLGALPLSGSPFDAAAPAGQYFVRVANASGLESNEVRLVVNPGCPPPAFPVGLSGRVVGNMVDLQWYPTPAYAATSLDTVTPLAYVLEAGRSPSTADVGTFSLGRTAAFATAAPTGRYYVRVRATSECGAGPASNDVTLDVP